MINCSGYGTLPALQNIPSCLLLIITLTPKGNHSPYLQHPRFNVAYFIKNFFLHFIYFLL